MDGVESIGMPVSLPLVEAPELIPYSASLQARRGTQAKRETQVAGNEPAAVDRRDEQEKQIGKDFESVLLTKLFDEVQASIQDSGFDEEDSGSQQVRGLFWLQLARDVADKGGFGLWKDIYQQIKQLEGVGNLTESINEEL